MRIIGFAGLKDSGKNSAALYFIKRGWRPIAFADGLKDGVSVMFRWPRPLLEGDTPESRRWRETVDEKWSKLLDIPGFTPRKGLEMVGTDAMRRTFGDKFWVARTAVEVDALPPDETVVFTDVRHHPEIDCIRERKGLVYRVKRGPDPDWMPDAILASRGDEAAVSRMHRRGLHPSEWEWTGAEFDGVIENDGTLDDLNNKLREIFGP